MSRFKRIAKKASAILCADIHMRSTTPACRTDDFLAAQANKWNHILGTSNSYDNIPILVAGDLGQNSQWPDWLERWFIYNATRFNTGQIYLVPGQHDLPNHRLELWEKSAIGVLEASKAINVIREGYVELDGFVIYGCPYGEDIPKPTHTLAPQQRLICMAHMMVIEDRKLWPDQSAPTGLKILKNNPSYDLILTGDNHNSFIASDGRRVLVNPGSMTRHKADQIDHRPRVYLWYAEDNTVEPLFLPIEEGVVSRVHIDKKETRDERIETFVTHLKDDYEIGLDFEENVEEFFRSNRTRKTIKDRTWEFMGGNNGQ